MGNEIFNTFNKDHKIEFEIKNKSNENIKYELQDNGRIINKTKNQSYCIVPDKSDYPLYDIIAIKYAYLLHGNEIAEKVANRTNLGLYNTHDTYSTQGHDYLEYVHYMNTNGWFRENIVITEESSIFNNISSIQNTKGYCKLLIAFKIVDITCPLVQKITIKGTNQVSRDSVLNDAYSIKLCIKDEYGNEISGRNKILIQKVKPSEYVLQLSRIYYSDINNGYHFENGLEINQEQHLVIYLISSEINIDKIITTFSIQADLWNR